MSLPVLYNRCYGGFNFSEAAVKRYNELVERTGDPKLSSMACDLKRTDRVMAMVVDELKEASHGFCAKLGIAWVDERYEEYVVVDEYDGSESVSIDFKRYKLDKIQEVADSKEKDDWKLTRIREILAEDEPNVNFD